METDWDRFINSDEGVYSTRMALARAQYEDYKYKTEALIMGENLRCANNKFDKLFVSIANPTIEKVIFNDPATIVYWSDKTKTVVKCQPGDEFDKERGLALAISKKFLGNKSNFNNQFKKWCV